MNPDKTQPTLYGVGLGPGDPELITLKAARCLEKAEIIAWPITREGASGYAEEILRRSGVLPEIDQKAMPLVFPMTRDPETLQKSWTEAASSIADALDSGKSVAFITEGDPLFYSTFIHLAEEVQTSRPHTRIETIAGVTSFCASASALGLGIADGDQKVAIIPATGDMERLRREIEQADTTILMKVAKVLDPVIELLEEMGLAGNASIVSRAGAPDQTVFTDMAELKNQKINYLSTMIIKKSISKTPRD